MKLSKDADDLECLNSVHGVLSKLKSDLDRRFASISLKRRPMLVYTQLLILYICIPTYHV